MKYLDSNILAYAFYRNEHTLRCQKAILQGGITSAFSLIEAFFIIEKETGSRESAQRSIRGLLKSSITVVDVDVNLVFESLKRSGRYKLSIFDMLHYSCATMSGCSAIISYDKDFDGLDIVREEPR